MADLLERFATAIQDRYRVERELGRGGMGVVLLAHDLKHDRKVALKVLRAEIAESVSGERFLREIHIAASLQHPNILALIDSGEIAGATYYVMPYVPGDSLRDRLDREKQLPLADALLIAREVAEALQHAHEHGVIHRDIKPENILLGAGHALVADFGIARAIDPAGGERLTETGIAVGTPAYMSPEQAAGTSDFDHRSDIYSLGCVLYEMLAGSPPFTGSTPMAVMARKALEPVPSLRVVRDTVPEEIERVIITALARVPADRFATARQFADALAGDASALGAVTREVRRSPARRWLVRAAVAGGAILFLTSLYALTVGLPWTGRGLGPLATSFTHLTSSPGAEWFPSLSADGAWIVYSAVEDGDRNIYLQSVGGETPINLTPDAKDDDDQPAFSPDGERIAFRSARGGGGIFVMGRTGEGVRRITNRGFRPTWSPDARQIAFVTENVELNPGNSESVSELWIVNADGSDARKLESGDAILPSWSPHGQRIAYARRLGAPAQGDIYTITPDGEPVRLTSDPARDWSPAWSPDGRHVYYVSNRGGSMNLWRIGVDEASGRPRGDPEPVTTPAEFLAHPAVSGDGRSIAYSSTQTSINIQRLGFDPVVGTVVGAPAGVTTGSRSWSSPDPSPDGALVAFYTLTQPEGNLYVSRPDGSGLRQLTADTAIDRLPRWSPDGQWIAMFSSRAGNLHLWKIRPDGSGLQQLTSAPAAYLAWSPDGSRLATVTGGTTIGDSLAVIDAGRTAETQRMELLPRSTIGQFLVNAWSPDGERLIGQLGAVGAMGRGIGTYSFRTRTYERLTDFGEWPVWLPDGRRALFVANGHDFFVVDARTKQVRRIYGLARDVIGPPRLTRDGRTMYFSRRVTEGDIWIATLR